MGELVLHPTHPLFKQLAHPTCPECHNEIFPITPVVIHHLPGGRYVVLHEECDPAGQDDKEIA